MTRDIPHDLFPRALQILLPLVATGDDREALLVQAFYLEDPLLYGIDRHGAPKVFAARCLKKLLEYGCLAEGDHALARLLRAARYDCGADKHAEIDALHPTVFISYARADAIDKSFLSLQNLRGEIMAHNKQHRPNQVNVTVDDDTREWFERCVQRYGKVSPARVVFEIIMQYRDLYEAAEEAKLAVLTEQKTGKASAPAVPHLARKAK